MLAALKLLLSRTLCFPATWKALIQKLKEISAVSTDTYDEGYIHQFQLEPTHKIH